MIKYINKLSETIIRGVSNIIAAVVSEYTKTLILDDGSTKVIKRYCINTNGSNFKDIVYIENLDLSKCVTDSVMEMTELLCIEAGRESIINEFRLAMQGLSPIHCTIYADEMTSPGIVSSIQRTGISIRENSNILLRSSFQYPVQTIEDAAENGIENKIYGISSSLSVGVPPKIGTTYSKVIVNQEFIKLNEKTLDQKLDEL